STRDWSSDVCSSDLEDKEPHPEPDAYDFSVCPALGAGRKESDRARTRPWRLQTSADAAGSDAGAILLPATPAPGTLPDASLDRQIGRASCRDSENDT